MSESPTIRRILIALDSRPDSLAGLEVAAALAARLRAELEALFVEDEALLRLAGFPLVGYHAAAAGSRLVEAALIEQTYRMEAEAIRRALAEAAARFGLTPALTVTRGPVARETASAAERADLVILPSGGARAIGAGRQALAGLGRPVLQLRAAYREEAPVMALDDGSEAGRRAVGVAAALARRDGGRITVLVPADRPDLLPALAELGRAAKLEVSVATLAVPLTAARLLAALGHAEASLLVLPRAYADPAFESARHSLVWVE